MTEVDPPGPGVDPLLRLAAGLARPNLLAVEVARIGADVVAHAFGDAAAVWQFRGQRPVLLANVGSPEAGARLASLMPDGAAPEVPAWHEHVLDGDAPAVLLPLLSGGRVVGTLGAGRREGGAPYGEPGRVVLRALADRLAAALELAAIRSEIALARTRTQALVRRSVDGALVTDAEGRIVFVGPSVSQLLGWDVSQMLGRSALALVHAEDVPAKRQRLADALTEPGPQEPLDVRVRHADGSWSWVEDRITNLLDDPEVAGLVLNFHDISERKAAQDSLRRSEARYRSIVETAQEGIWVVDPSARTVFANQKLADIIGRPVGEVQSMNVLDIVPEEARAAQLERLRQRPETGHEVYELPFVRADGEQRLAHVSASPLFGDQAQYVGSLAMLTDITDRRQVEEQLARRALYDDLTGLANRSLFLDRLRQALARRDAPSPVVAVLFLDLDHFKLVNDSYGHPVGDRLLVEVAGRLVGVVRLGDTVGRIAGDEFVVLCPGLDEDGARALAQRVLAALATPFQLDGIDVQLTASVGIAEATLDQDPQTVLGDADAAMLHAKRSGRGTHATYDSNTGAYARDRLQEMADLRRGLAAGEFVLAYQPQVDLASGDVVAAEALVRWQHPTRGLVAPDDFIPLAERTGLIVPLGWTVLAAACRQAAEWSRTLKTPPRVSVNVSARQFHDDRLVGQLGQQLRDNDLPPRLLCLELTESTVMDDIDRAVRILGELRSLGVALSIDDFGTGYSSLAYLSRLPLDELKIDREFVSGIQLGGEDLEIVRAVIVMAHALGLEVVAEGVETVGLASVLRELDCDVGQGFLFARPGTPQALAQML